jgi:hypothetical protein
MRSETLGDASDEIWHAEFVAKTAPGGTWGGAVCSPDAIISLENLSSQRSQSLCLAGLFLISSKL